jgi:hypothetical protein
LRNAAEELWRVRAILRNDRVELRVIRVALEGDDRKGGLIEVLADDAGDHWSIAEKVRGYRLALLSVREPNMKKAAEYLDQAYVVLQEESAPASG